MSTPTLNEPDRAPDSFWRIVGQSLKGESHDYTSVSLNRAVLLLAIPMVLEMIMESLFAVVDVFWVAHLGSDAIAVVGITEAVMALVYALAIGISIAATAIVARRIGEQDPERAAQTAGQIVMLGVTISSGMGLILGWFAADILSLMGASDNIVALGTDFARLMLGGNGTVFMIFLINAIFRGAGDAVIAMRTLWLANALNIVLGPCFIFGWGPFPEMGLVGAAVATNIGRGIGVLYQLWHLTGHHSRIRVRPRHLWPVVELLKLIMITASNGVAQMLINTTSWIGLVKIIAPFGSAALAGYTIAMRIIIFALMPAWGLSNAAATLVGQNLGAHKPERATAAVKIATRMNMLFLGVIGALFVILSGPLVGFFSAEPQVLAYGKQALWIVALAFPLYAAGMCMEAAFNGAGDTRTPTRLNFYCFWLGQLPLAWLLAHTFQLGPLGVFIAVPVSYSALAIWALQLFRQGRWQQQQV